MRGKGKEKVLLTKCLEYRLAPCFFAPYINLRVGSKGARVPIKVY